MEYHFDAQQQLQITCFIVLEVRCFYFDYVYLLIWNLVSHDIFLEHYMAL